VINFSKKREAWTYWKTI